MMFRSQTASTIGRSLSMVRASLVLAAFLSLQGLAAFAAPTVTLNIPSIGSQDGTVSTALAVDANNSSASAIRIGNNAANDGFRGVMSFDTSVIPATAEILDVKLQVTRGARVGIPDDPTFQAPPWIEIVKGTYGTAALEGTDFSTVSDAGDQATTPLIIPSADDTSSQSSLLAVKNFVNQGVGAPRYTQCRIRFFKVASNFMEDDYFGFYGGEAANSAFWPYLIVTYRNPLIKVVPSSLNFGTQVTTAGPTTAQNLVIENIGSSDLTLSSVTITGASAAEFIKTSDTGETVLLPGGTRTLQIVFDPSLPAGSKAANVEIVSDALNTPTVNVPLSGNATLVAAQQVFGYYPANANGRGTVFFFDKQPPVGAQSYKLEVRREDQTTIVIFQTIYNLAGPPGGDVVRSSEFDLPRADISIPTSYEIDMQFRIFVYSGLNATGSLLKVSNFAYAMHPSADVTQALFTAPPVTAGVEPFSMTDKRPTAQYTSYSYELFRTALPSGTQTVLSMLDHNYLGQYQTKDVHPQVTRTTALPMQSGPQLIYVRPRRQYFNITGASLGRFDIAHQSPIISITVP